MQRHPNPMPRTKRDQRLRLHRMAGHKLKAKALRERSNHDRSLQQREPLADATPWAISKRIVSAIRQTARETLNPSLRPKSIRIVVVARVAMRDPLRKNNRGSRQKFVAADLALLDI